MFYKNKLNYFFAQYQTRQQLYDLSDHILKDIGQSLETVEKELIKNAFPQVIYHFIHYIKKGV
jgi:uncharacterized protein YjiS (DUF1127 family)